MSSGNQLAAFTLSSRRPTQFNFLHAATLEALSVGPEGILLHVDVAFASWAPFEKKHLAFLVFSNGSNGPESVDIVNGILLRCRPMMRDASISLNLRHSDDILYVYTGCLR